MCLVSGGLEKNVCLVSGGLEKMCVWYLEVWKKCVSGIWRSGKNVCLVSGGLEKMCVWYLEVLQPKPVQCLFNSMLLIYVVSRHD